MPTGLELIEQERQRQVKEEGFDANHDSRHIPGILAEAGYSYFLSAITGHYQTYAPEYWPFDEEWWKPKGMIKDLTRAGALYQAEIDRLERAKEKVVKQLDKEIALRGF